MGNTRHDLAGSLFLETYLPAHLAATPTEILTSIKVPFKAKVFSVSFVPMAPVTGANTNYTNINIINKGSNGVGATEVAHIDFTGGTNASAYVEKALTLNSSSNLALSEGDILAIQHEKVRTGLDIPAGKIIVELQGN